MHVLSFNCKSRAKHHSKGQNSHVKFDVITRRLPGENVVFNEERPFEKFPYFQETTRTLRNITSFPLGAGGRRQGMESEPDSDAAHPLLRCLHSVWETTKADLNQKNAAQMRCEPLPLPPVLPTARDLRIFISGQGCRNQKLLLEVLNSFFTRSFSPDQCELRPLIC